MCGWVGVFGALESEERLRAAGATLATRGPDGSGQRVVRDGPLPAGMAHQRLSILDPTPAGAQPMHDPERGVSLVYNGEIYNSPELRQELVSRGVRFRSKSDTEVLLRGWVEWGDEVLQRIDGIFSFALLDERHGRLLMARDRSGIKPLYWTEKDGMVVAGSAPRALLSLRPALGRDLDHVALAQFLTLLWIPHPRTPWSAIHKLAPGSALELQGGRLREWRYWTAPEPTGRVLQPDALRAALERATTRQLLSDVPVGLLLSGGLDSSLLLEFMVGYYEEGSLDAFTVGYDQAAQRLEISPDDSVFARQVADRHRQVTLSEVQLGGEPESDLDELSPHFDDPVADPAAISLYRLCQKSTAKVLLSGVGGEELFAGYPRHVALGLARRAAGLPLQARRMMASASSVLGGSRPGPFYRARRNAQKLARAVSDSRPPHYWRMMAQLTQAELEALVPDGAHAALDELDSGSNPLARTSLSDALAFDRQQFLPNLNLAYVDKAAMATGVEVRVPLLDESVLAMAYAADPNRFIDGRTTKVPLRRAATDLLPTAVIDRPKSGFGGPARAWFQGAASDSLRERVEALADTGLVQRDAALRIFAAAANGTKDMALGAWALVCLHAWHRDHVV